MSVKQDKRLESKKRKAVAFLQLVKEKESFEEVKKSKFDNDASQEIVTQPASTENSDTANSTAQTSRTQNVTPSTSQMSSDNQNCQQMAEDELLRLRQALRERQKASMQRPKVFLTLEEFARENAFNFGTEVSDIEVPPLFIRDIQSLILFAVQGSACRFKPRWCRLMRGMKISSMVVMVMDGVSKTEIETYPDSFPTLKSHFDMHIDVVSPSQYSSSVPAEFFRVFPSANQLEQMGVINKTKAKSKPPAIETEPPRDEDKGEQNPLHPALYQNDAFSRTSLLLSSAQLMQEKYPLPVKYSNVTMTSFSFTKDKYAAVDDRSPIFALDCEMCMTTAREPELTRISIVNENLEIIYDRYVKPFNRITNYLTKYSGITKKILDPVTTRLTDVQRDVKELLPANAILCGQSLGSDLRALKMYHPYVIDTSCIYNLSGRSGFKTGLKKLSAHFLQETIQESKDGHSSVEDSVATIKLVQLKLKHDLAFGDVRMGWSEGLQTKINLENQNTLASNTEETTDLKLGTEYKIMKIGEDEKQVRVSGDQANQIAFFKSQEYFYSLFEVLKKFGKTAGMIADKETVEKFGSDNVVAMESDSDKRTKNLAKSYVQFHDFVYVNFQNYLNHIECESEDEKISHCLQKMDKRIGKILKNTKSCSLVVVVIPGRSEKDKEHSGITFLKIV